MLVINSQEQPQENVKIGFFVHNALDFDFLMTGRT